MQPTGIILRYKLYLSTNRPEDLIFVTYAFSVQIDPTFICNCRWNTEIQEGIYTMLEMLVDLVATRLESDPVPSGLLATLSLVSCITKIE